MDDEPCFVVALEVLDNLPHDRVVRVRFERGGGGGEGRWLQTRVVPTPPSSSSSRKAFTEVLEPMTDALLTRTTAAIFGSGGGGETAPRTLPFARRASLGPRVWFGLTRGGMQLHQSRELRITDARLSTLDPSQAAAGSPAPSSASSAASSPPPSLSLSLELEWGHRLRPHGRDGASRDAARRAAEPSTRRRGLRFSSRDDDRGRARAAGRVAGASSFLHSSRRSSRDRVHVYAGPRAKEGRDFIFPAGLAFLSARALSVSIVTDAPRRPPRDSTDAPPNSAPTSPRLARINALSSRAAGRSIRTRISSTSVEASDAATRTSFSPRISTRSRG